MSGILVEGRAGDPNADPASTSTLTEGDFVFDSGLGATGVLQHPFGDSDCAADIARQQGAAIEGALMQHAGRPAAATGITISVASRNAADFVRGITTDQDSGAGLSRQERPRQLVQIWPQPVE